MPKIKFNLNEIGRVKTGKHRQFSVDKIVRYINSPQFQEMIVNGDVTGYYGHWVRRALGMSPKESGLDKNGNTVTANPAVITRYIKAYENGDIEHETEFLGTSEGIVAQKLFSSKVGGFSTAINNITGRLFGFDYVLSPNNIKNKGYLLDDSGDDSDDSGLLLDDYRNEMKAFGKIISGDNLAFKEVSEALQHSVDEIQQMAARIKSLESQTYAPKGILAFEDNVNLFDEFTPTTKKPHSFKEDSYKKEVAYQDFLEAGLFNV